MVIVPPSALNVFLFYANQTLFIPLFNNLVHFYTAACSVKLILVDYIISQPIYEISHKGYFWNISVGSEC